MENQRIINIPCDRSYYGGTRLIIDGRRASICSCAGFAEYNMGLWNKHSLAQAVKDAEARGLTLEQHVAVECGNAVERAKEMGHDLYWVNLTATCLLGDAQAREADRAEWEGVLRVTCADVIQFEGKTFKIHPAPNYNYRLEAAVPSH